MSDHRTYEARFGALFDGDLEAEPRAEIEAHFAVCPQCSAAWRRYTASADTLRLGAAQPTPQAHVAAVMARVAGAYSLDTLARPSGAGAAGPAASFVTQLRPTTRWRTLATHGAALAAGALAMIALAPLFGARESTSISERNPSTAVAAPSTHDSDRVARASAEQTAAARAAQRRDSHRSVAAALATQQVALARALVERHAAESVAAAEVARARAAEAQRAEAQRAEAQRAEAQRAETEAFAAVALVRSFERLGVTLAQLDAELVARADATLRAEAAPTRANEPAHPAAPTARDWRAIDIDAASLAATGRRAEHVTIRREGDRVALSTSGALDDIVAALLARLDDPDPAVRTAVELRLDDIAVELGVARAERARPRKGADEPWWRSDRGQVAALTIGGTGEAREPWPDWWSRARSTVGP